MNDSRTLRWFIVLLVLAIIALALHAVLQSSDGGHAGTQSPPAQAQGGHATPAATADGIGATAQADGKVIREATSTLQEYISILPTGDFAKADAYWMQRQPSGNEADLRALPAVPTSIRLQTHSPEAAPSDATPGAVEIPFELRLNVPGAGFRHYRGRYRLVRDDGKRWKIMSASVDALPPAG